MRMYVGSVYLFIKAVYIRFFSAYHAVVRLWMIFRLAESGKQFCASCFRKLWKTEDFCVSVYGKHAGKPLFFSIWWRKYGKKVLPFCLFLEIMAVRPVCGVRRSRLVSFQYGWKRFPGLSFVHRRMRENRIKPTDAFLWGEFAILMGTEMAFCQGGQRNVGW